MLNLREEIAELFEEAQEKDQFYWRIHVASPGKPGHVIIRAGGDDDDKKLREVHAQLIEGLSW